MSHPKIIGVGDQELLRSRVRQGSFDLVLCQFERVPRQTACGMASANDLDCLCGPGFKWGDASDGSTVYYSVDHLLHARGPDR